MTNYVDDFQFMVVQVTFCLIEVSSDFSYQDDDDQTNGVCVVEIIFANKKVAGTIIILFSYYY